MSVREPSSICDISMNRLRSYAHTIGFSILKPLLCHRESQLLNAASPIIGGDDMLIPSASVHSNRCRATERDNMHDKDLTIREWKIENSHKEHEIEPEKVMDSENAKRVS
jgi:hypothetical protein